MPAYKYTARQECPFGGQFYRLNIQMVCSLRLRNEKGGSVFAPAIVIFSLAFLVQKVEIITAVANRLCVDIEILYRLSAVCQYQFQH